MKRCSWSIEKGDSVIKMSGLVSGSVKIDGKYIQQEKEMGLNPVKQQGSSFVWDLDRGKRESIGRS